MGKRSRSKVSSAEPIYLPASAIDVTGTTIAIRKMAELDTASLTSTFGAPIHPGDQGVHGPTWAARDQHGNRWSIYTSFGKWQIGSRGSEPRSAANRPATDAFVEYVLAHCKAGRA